MAPLNEKSIFKSLHSVHSSKFVTQEELAAMNMAGALREWFLHGRVVYEARRLQIQQIAAQTGLIHRVAGLEFSFDTRLQHFRDKHFPSEP